jgi:hypothetical protein
MIEFIFMLTRDDVTLPNAREIYASVADSGVRHVGCKDLGLDARELAGLMDDIRANGHHTYMEVVSETPEATLESARVAARVRPDYLIGGTLIEPVQEILADTQRAAELGVDGVNLLAYRYDKDVEALTRAVVQASDLPVICAGSVDSAERIRALDECGAWAFTIGTAALDGKLADGLPLRGQLQAALEAAGAKAPAA